MKSQWLVLVHVFLVCIGTSVHFHASAQWQDFSIKSAEPKYIIWVDSDYMYVNLNGRDVIIQDNGTTYDTVPFSGENAFPIDDSSFVGYDGVNINIFYSSGAIKENIDYRFFLTSPNDPINYLVFLTFNPDHWMAIIQQGEDVTTLVSSNSGDSWTVIPNLFVASLSKPIVMFEMMFHYQVIDNWVWMYSSSVPDTLYRSDDSGMSWEKIKLPEWLKPAPLRSFAFANKDTGLMTCYIDNGLAKTVDGGLTWNTDGLVRPLSKNEKLAFAKATPDKDALFFVYGTDGCHFSSSNGQWWKPLDTLSHFYLSFYDAEHGYSFYQETGGVYYQYRLFQNSLNTDVKIPFPMEIQVYPNPVSNWLYAYTDRPIHAELFDMKGNKLIVMDDLSQSNPMDVQTLAIGYYLIYLPELNIRKLVYVGE